MDISAVKTAAFPIKRGRYQHAADSTASRRRPQVHAACRLISMTRAASPSWICIFLELFRLLCLSDVINEEINSRLMSGGREALKAQTSAGCFFFFFGACGEIKIIYITGRGGGGDQISGSLLNVMDLFKKSRAGAFSHPNVYFGHSAARSSAPAFSFISKAVTVFFSPVV